MAACTSAIEHISFSSLVTFLLAYGQGYLNPRWLAGEVDDEQAAIDMFTLYLNFCRCTSLPAPRTHKDLSASLHTYHDKDKHAHTTSIALLENLVRDPTHDLIFQVLRVYRQELDTFMRDLANEEFSGTIPLGSEEFLKNLLSLKGLPARTKAKSVRSHGPNFCDSKNVILAFEEDLMGGYPMDGGETKAQATRETASDVIVDYEQDKAEVNLYI